eukprot:gnl/Trimastix_PCT/4033.p1 GENE.gnl/Trimastix_PCT/4033~~gnl/Trimastix_PCT/4033.p1  ORF type:complete len:836 (-),score=228.66 gnl/Trimastix_PCT/4033:21-2528(-)
MSSRNVSRVFSFALFLFLASFLGAQAVTLPNPTSCSIWPPACTTKCNSICPKYLCAEPGKVIECTWDVSNYVHSTIKLGFVPRAFNTSDFVRYNVTWVNGKGNPITFRNMNVTGCNEGTETEIPNVLLNDTTLKIRFGAEVGRLFLGYRGSRYCDDYPMRLRTQIQASISLDRPSFGTQWTVGKTEEIRWEVQGAIPAVNVSFYNPSQDRWTDLLVAHTNKTGVLPFTIPYCLNASNTYRIRVRAADVPAEKIEVSQLFTIRSCFDFVTSPGIRIDTLENQTVEYSLREECSSVCPKAALRLWDTDDDLFRRVLRPFTPIIADVSKPEKYIWWVQASEGGNTRMWADCIQQTPASMDIHKLCGAYPNITAQSSQFRIRESWYFDNPQKEQGYRGGDVLRILWRNRENCRNAVPAVRLQLVRKGVFAAAISKPLLNTDLEDNDPHEFLYTIPSNLPPSGDYAVRIIAHNSTTTLGQPISEAFVDSPAFWIYKYDCLRFTYPTTRLNLTIGDNVNITWRSVCPAKQVTIKLQNSYPDFNFPERYILGTNATHGVSSLGHFLWKVPMDIDSSAHYRFRIQSPDQSLYLDTSVHFAVTGRFNTISPPSDAVQTVQVAWDAQSDYNVTWVVHPAHRAAVSSVVAQLVGGYSTEVICNLTSPAGVALDSQGRGTANYTVPSRIGNGLYRFRFHSAADATFVGHSRIVRLRNCAASSSFVFTQPTMASTLYKTNWVNLQWTTSGCHLPTVSLELYKFSTTNTLQPNLIKVATLASSLANTGSFNWTISSSLKTGTDYQVQIRDTVYGVVRNSQYFRILDHLTPIPTPSKGHRSTRPSLWLTV